MARELTQSGRQLGHENSSARADPTLKWSTTSILKNRIRLVVRLALASCKALRGAVR